MDAAAPVFHSHHRLHQKKRYKKISWKTKSSALAFCIHRRLNQRHACIQCHHAQTKTVSFFVLPLFAFCSWWISFGIRSLSDFTHSFLCSERNKANLPINKCSFVWRSWLRWIGQLPHLFIQWSETHDQRQTMRAQYAPSTLQLLSDVQCKRQNFGRICFAREAIIKRNNRGITESTGGDDPSEIRDAEILKKRLQHKIRHRTHSHTNNNKNFKCSLWCSSSCLSIVEREVINTCSYTTTQREIRFVRINWFSSRMKRTAHLNITTTVPSQSHSHYHYPPQTTARKVGVLWCLWDASPFILEYGMKIGVSSLLQEVATFVDGRRTPKASSPGAIVERVTILTEETAPTKNTRQP